MKKLSTLLAVLLISLAAHAGPTVESYKSSFFGKEYSIVALQENEKIDKVFIEIQAASSKKACIVVRGIYLELFKTALELVRDKYCDWVKIAQDNNITEMKKEFGIEFPPVIVAWQGSEWWFDLEQNVNMSFLIVDNKRFVAVWNQKVTASSNEYIDEDVYFVFEGAEDFNDLISQLDYQRILDKLLNRKKTEDLFQ